MLNSSISSNHHNRIFGPFKISNEKFSMFVHWGVNIGTPPCRELLKGTVKRGYRLKHNHFRSKSRPIRVLSDVPVSRS